MSAYHHSRHHPGCHRESSEDAKHSHSHFRLNHIYVMIRAHVIGHILTTIIATYTHTYCVASPRTKTLRRFSFAIFWWVQCFHRNPYQLSCFTRNIGFKTFANLYPFLSHHFYKVTPFLSKLMSNATVEQ